MKKLRVLVLVHSHLLPPDTAGPDNRLGADWMTEYDVLQSLQNLGHFVIPLGVKDELITIRQGIEDHKPHIAFNLLTFFHGVGTYDAYVVSYLELLKMAYTGSNPRGILLCGDKALSKKVMSYHRIPAPAFAVFRWGRRVRKPRRLEYPLIVKSNLEHASLGIAQASIVHDDAGLQERVEFVHRTLGTDVIAEQYIEGRELTVSILGNERLTVFPVWEMTFENLPDGSEPIATAKVKWDLKYQKKIGVKTGPADLDAEKLKEVHRITKRVYRSLDLSGFARVDLRLTPDGRIYVLEANPNPQLAVGEDLADSAATAGLPYDALVQRILSLGLGYKPEWKE